MGYRRRATGFIAAAMFAVLGAATAEGDGSTSEESEDDLSGLSPIERVTNLESEWEEGEPFSRGPGAEAIATAIQSNLTSEDSVAVEVLPGEPRRIIVVLSLPDFDMLPAREQQLELVGVHDLIEGARGAHVYIGIRDGIGYAAVLSRAPGQWPPTIDTDPSDGRGVMSQVFTIEVAPPASPEPVAPPASPPELANVHCWHAELDGACEQPFTTSLSSAEQVCDDAGGELRDGPCPNENRVEGHCDVAIAGYRYYYYGEIDGPDEVCRLVTGTWVSVEPDPDSEK